MATKMSGAEYMAKTIHGYGTTHIFFVEAILREVTKYAEKMGIKGIMAHSENAASYMADGYSRVSGRPGVCMCQSIGSANLAAGVAEAWLANSPVIAFTGKKPPRWQYKNSYQEINHTKIFDGITKFNAEISEAEQVSYLLRQCYKEAVSGKPRPVHLDVPGLTGRDLELYEIDAPLQIEKTFGKYPPLRTAIEKQYFEEAAKTIEDAERPLIVVGRGAVVSGAEAEIAELARKADIPIVTTPDGKCIIDEADKLWSGVIGFYGMDCANRLAANADLVIFIGTQASDQTTNDWQTPPPETKTIQIDIEPSEIGRNYADCVGLVGDAKEITGLLAGHVVKKTNKIWRNQADMWKNETLEYYESLINSNHEPMTAECMCREIEKALPEDAVLVSDTGYSAIWSSTMIRMKPSQKYIRAAGSLGWAFPGSLGVKCGAPNRPVVCLIGDGGFFYHLSEMETAVKYGINSVTIVNNNRVMSQGLPNLTALYPEDREKAVKRISYPDINFSKIAEEMGLYSARITKPDDIVESIGEAINAGKPALIEIMTYGDHKTPNPLSFLK